MTWIIAWAITSLLLLGSMLFNGRLVLRNHKMLGTMERMQKELREQSNLNLRLAKEVGEDVLKRIEEANGK